MKKLICIILIALCSLMLVACSSNKQSEDDNEVKSQPEAVEVADNENGYDEDEYNDYMKEAKSNIIKEDYDKAKEYLNLALESKENDREASNLLEQLEIFIKVQNLCKNGQEYDSIKWINKMDLIDTESDVLNNKVEVYKDQCIMCVEDSIAATNEYMNVGNYTGLETDLQELIDEIKDVEFLQSQVETCKSILENCKLEIAKENEEVYCGFCNQYVKRKYFVETEAEQDRCLACHAERDLRSTATNVNCPYCNAPYSVSLRDGDCFECGMQVFSPVREIYHDGTIVLEDGTRWQYRIIDGASQFLDENGNVFDN